MNRVANHERKRLSNSTPSAIDRLPPHDIPAEQGVIGSILLDARSAISEVQGLIGIDSFYDLRHQHLYELLSGMIDRGERVDLITVQNELKKRGWLEAVGGLTYLSALLDCSPSALAGESYAQIVHEKYLLRRLIQVCTESVSKVYDNEGTAASILDAAETNLLRLGQERNEGKEKEIKALVNHAIEQIEACHQRKGQTTGLATGFTDLDKMTSGLHPGDVFVLAGRPSTGKTSLAMNIVEYVGIELGMPVGVFSLEMTAESLVLRMLCSRARINMRAVREGFLAERDFPKLTGAAIKIASSKIRIDDTPSLNLMKLRSKARRMYQQHQIKLIAIDYLQLMSGGNHREEQEREIAEISKGVKALAKELNIPIILLSQLNRNSEHEQRAPRISDLRSSGNIEQDADLIGLLYKPKVKKDEEEPENSDVCIEQLIIGKQRNGPTGEIDLTFFKSFTRFESAAKVQEEEYPRSNDP